MRTKRAGQSRRVFRPRTVNGWKDYSEFNFSAPYTIIIGRGVKARKSIHEFACDGDAVRWATAQLGCNLERVRVYRGRRPRGKPLMEIRASDR